MRLPHTYAEDGPNFIEGLHNYDGKRLDKLKQELYQQANENRHQLTVL